MKRCKLFVATCLLGVLLIKGSALADAPHDSASLPLEHRAVYGPPPPGSYGPPPPGLGSLNTVGDDPWPLSAPDMPQIKHLQVQCEKTHMRVNIEFDRPFYGMIFSKGFYSDPHCVHLKPGTGHLSATFEIFLNSCGMTSSANAGGGGNGVVPHGAYGAPPTPSGSYVENTIIIQYDPYVQEVWDQARKLRCTWYDFYEKAVTFRPFQVDMLHAVTANFLGDNLQCWMQIQVGKGPWASEVSGIVKIGQTMTMVLAIKDDENKFDMLVRNCVAHDGKRAPIQLVDQYGCVVRPKIMSRFQKIKNFGPSASVVSFAYFQAFKFPDSMNVHFQCVIQVCRYNCPEPKCAGGLPGGDFPALGGPGPAEYGVPAGGPGLGGDYGVPVAAVGPEYGLANFGLDPRHPAGPSGAYSEPKPEVVPAPQAQIDNKNSTEATAETQQPQQDGNTDAEQPNNVNQNNVNNHHDDSLRPPPPPSSGRPVYSTIRRKGDVESSHISGGKPRAILPAELHGVRRRRDTVDVVIKPRIYKREAQEMTDIDTERIIQVVAPGDVNFNLNAAAANNETVVIQSAPSTDQEHICLSIASFVAGLSMLLMVLVVACLVAAFLFVRVRAVDRKNATTTYFDGPAEFVKHAN
ncbi:cuticlin-4 [Cloeon dipterum]|uniref:cuticlin-4 n=1 Tax=Cloeon dipterum TaxID=197152 RepID=UPI00321FEAE6